MTSIYYYFHVVGHIEGCFNYTTHNDPWRHVWSRANNTNTTCDYRKLSTGWHRFIGNGTKLYNGSCVSIGKCGTRSPGWMRGSYPTVIGAKVNATIHFHTYYCADDFGVVSIRNCGSFFTFKFTKLPYWSCNYGLCTI